MLNTFEVNKVLIIAPLRVARDTWPAEIEKWDHLKNLDISIVVGDVKTRIAAVHHPAMIYVVNRENVKWLVEYYEKNGMRWDFGMVVIDELSSFKNYQSQRFKFLRKVRPYVKRWVGLTGTPSSNGLMDLWAEIGILDGGERLGKFIGRYPGCPDPSGISRTRSEYPAGRTHPDLVRSDLVFGTVSADQCQTLATGADGCGHHPPYYHKGHGGRGCHGGFGAEGHDTGKTDLSGQGTAGKIGENMKKYLFLNAENRRPAEESDYR